MKRMRNPAGIPGVLMLIQNPKKKSDLIYRAKEAYYDYVRTGVKDFKEESEQLYEEYKQAGGKKPLKDKRWGNPRKKQDIAPMLVFAGLVTLGVWWVFIRGR